VVTKPYRLKPFSGRGLASACFCLLHFYIELGTSISLEYFEGNRISKEFEKSYEAIVEQEKMDPQLKSLVTIKYPAKKTSGGAK
jgi:hypothetical protein